MKKVLASVLMVVLLASLSFAAVKPAKIASRGDNGMKLGVGVEGGLPYIRLGISDTQNIDLGATYSSTGTNVNSMTVMARYNATIMPINDMLKVYWQAGVNYTSANAVPVVAVVTTTTMALYIDLGVEAMLNPNLSVYSDVGIVNYASLNTGGATTTNFGILQGSNVAYSGIRVYL